MGQLMEQMQNYELAITYYSQALSLEPAHNQTWYLIHNNLGYCLNHFGRHAEAVPYLQQAIQIDPLRHNAYKNMGIACEGLGQYAEAAIFYIKAVQTNASDPRALRHLETLVEKQPTVVNDVPDFPMHLAACRAAVHHAMEVRRVVIKDTVRPE
jgi:tetratricopeptide (TPR) repeat protein